MIIDVETVILDVSTHMQIFSGRFKPWSQWLRHGTLVDLPCRVESHLLPPEGLQARKGLMEWRKEKKQEEKA